ncbi:hypothetical protein AA476_24255 [Salmonella enterica subsp. enterica serovar Muenchen]|nr:hypothetical protein [Salmonella enterica subsp. enterica serovar Muenchen]
MGCVHLILHYSVEDGGEFHTPLRGIPRGSALSNGIRLRKQLCYNNLIFIGVCTDGYISFPE